MATQKLVKLARRSVVAREIWEIKRGITRCQLLINKGKYREAAEHLHQLADILFALARADEGDVKAMLDVAWWYLTKAESKLMDMG